MQGLILPGGEPGKEKRNAPVEITGREESSFYIRRMGTDITAFVRKGLFSLPDNARLPVFSGKGGVGKQPHNTRLLRSVPKWYGVRSQ